MSNSYLVGIVEVFYEYMSEVLYEVEILYEYLILYDLFE